MNHTLVGIERRYDGSGESSRRCIYRMRGGGHLSPEAETCGGWEGSANSGLKWCIGDRMARWRKALFIPLAI